MGQKPKPVLLLQNALLEQLRKLLLSQRNGIRLQAALCRPSARSKAFDGGGFRFIARIDDDDADAVIIDELEIARAAFKQKSVCRDIPAEIIRIPLLLFIFKKPIEIGADARLVCRGILLSDLPRKMLPHLHMLVCRGRYGTL